MDWPHGSHANTFGGNLLACAAGMASLRFMREKNLGKNARSTGKYMLKRLEKMKENYEIIGDVRGIGLMIGVEIVKSKKTKEYGKEEMRQILCKASEKGLILLPAGESVIRICPPLILKKREAEHGLDIFEDSVEETVKQKAI
jgi:4-aminobutyrate aminotransferase